MKIQYYFYILLLIVSLLDFATFTFMDPQRETNPLWNVLPEQEYVLFAFIYTTAFVIIISLTEVLLAHASDKKPLMAFFAFSLIIFGCQAHVLGALSNIDAVHYINLLRSLGINGNKTADYVIFATLYFTPIPLSLLAFRGWQKHHEDQGRAINDLKGFDRSVQGVRQLFRYFQ